MAESMRPLLLEKSMNFRLNVRQMQLNQLFSRRRAQVIEVPSFFHDFHSKFPSLTEPQIEENLEKLRISINTLENSQLSFKEVSSSGVLTDILRVLEKMESSQKVVTDAFWVIGELCAGEAAFSSFFTGKEVNILGKALDFIRIFKEQDQVLLMIFFALGNMTGSDPVLAKTLIKLEILPTVVSLFKINRSIALIQEITWFLSVVLQARAHISQKAIEPIFPVLAQCLLIEDQEVISNTLWSLKPFFSVADLAFVRCSLSLIDQILTMLKRTYADKIEVVFPGIRLLGCLLSGSDEVARMLIRKGVLEVLALHFETKTVKSQVCWCVGNLLACKSEDILIKVLKNGQIIGKTLEVLLSGQNNERREVLYGLVESFNTISMDLIRMLLEKGLGEGLLTGLNSEDAKTKLLALKGVKRLCKRGEEIFREDGLNEMVVRMDQAFNLGNVIEQIYNETKNPDTHRISYKILEKYYYFV